MLNHGRRILMAALIASFSMTVLAAPHFSTKKIKVGQKVIKVEVADTPEKLQHGLMYRRSLGIDEGMLFIFPREQALSFWMKNTFINLSIGFFSREKILIQVREMTAVKSEMQTNFEVYECSGLAQYALEMRQGWFTKNNIKVGDKLDLLIKE